MVTIEQAIEVAKKVMDDYPVVEVLDVGEAYAVGYDLGEIPEPGVPAHILVDKQTREIEFLTVPPIENLELIDSALVVWKVD